MPVTEVLVPLGVLETPPFFTDLLDDFLAEAALGVPLVLGVADFFEEATFGDFFADALGVTALAAAAAGDSSILWRLLDFCAD